jgi:uridine kinase
MRLASLRLRDPGTSSRAARLPLAPMRPLIMGIAGGSGSGKSTVARKIAEALTPASVAFLDMDAYYQNHVELTLEERRHLNWDHPDAFDFDLLASQLGALAQGDPIDKPVYDFVSHLREPHTVRIPTSDVVLVDGILLFVDARVRDRCDVKVFVDTDADVRLIRRIRRDMARRGRPLEAILEQYLTTVQPMHQQFVEPSKRYADIIVPRGGHNTVAIDLIIATIQRRLQQGTP